MDSNQQGLLDIFEQKAKIAKRELSLQFGVDFNIKNMEHRDVFSAEVEKIAMYYYWKEKLEHFKKNDGMKYIIIKNHCKNLKRDVRNIRQENLVISQLKFELANPYIY